MPRTFSAAFDGGECDTCLTTFIAGDEIGYLADQIVCAPCLDENDMENSVTDTDTANPAPAGPDEGADRPGARRGAGPVVFPEKPANPHEAPLSVNFSPDRAPQVTVRGRTVGEWATLLREVESSGVLGVIGEAYAALRAQAALGAGLGPATPVQAAQPPAPPVPPPGTGPVYNPQTPPPGVPGHAPAAWQNAGAPPAPPAPGAQQWGGQQNGGGNARGPKERPAWPVVYKINVPFDQKDAFKAFREQYKDAFRGKVAWGGGGSYWIHGDVVQSFANYTPVPA